MASTISYAVTVKDELKELRELMSKLELIQEITDEVVVVMDTSCNDADVKEYLLQPYRKCKTYSYEFNADFSAMKNYLNSKCTSDWIFQLDADELPDDILLMNLHDILDANLDVDAIWVPRVNKVTGITQEHINMWHWNVDEQNRVNWPDFQCRLYRNKPEIKWVNKVHEQLTGYKRMSHLPQDQNFSIWHIKDIKRQELQNHYYGSIQNAN